MIEFIEWNDNLTDELEPLFELSIPRLETLETMPDEVLKKIFASLNPLLIRAVCKRFRNLVKPVQITGAENRKIATLPFSDVQTVQVIRTRSRMSIDLCTTSNRVDAYIISGLTMKPTFRVNLHTYNPEAYYAFAQVVTLHLSQCDIDTLEWMSASDVTLVSCRLRTLGSVARKYVRMIDMCWNPSLVNSLLQTTAIEFTRMIGVCSLRVVDMQRTRAVSYRGCKNYPIIADYTIIDAPAVEIPSTCRVRNQIYCRLLGIMTTSVFRTRYVYHADILVLNLPTRSYINLTEFRISTVIIDIHPMSTVAVNPGVRVLNMQKISHRSAITELLQTTQAECQIGTGSLPVINSPGSLVWSTGYTTPRF